MARVGLDEIEVIGAGQTLYRPPRHDLLRLPLLGRLLRARNGRLLLQLPLLLAALLLIYDGLTGPPLAPQNLATVGVWVHYRGLVMVALLLVGNLFCMGCPFTLPRTLARRLSGRGRRWPRALRNKWLAVAAFIAFLFLYEWLDLWAGPRLTAAVIIGYFAGAFVLEADYRPRPRRVPRLPRQGVRQRLGPRPGLWHRAVPADGAQQPRLCLLPRLRPRLPL